MRYSTILFDIDDTLVDFKQSERVSLELCHAAFYRDVIDFSTFEKEYVKINRSLWKRVEQGEIQPSFVSQERFRQLSYLLKIDFDPSSPKFYEEQLIHHSVLIDGADDVLEYFKSRKIKIGFLTNGFAHLQQSKYKKLFLDRYSDVLVISEEVGFSKPHPEIFRHALQAIGSEPQNTLMVGDSLESDGKGARQAQMGFCWYTKTPGTLDWKPDFIISHLRELIFEFICV